MNDARAPAVTPARSPWNFDPERLGGHECDAWVGYYRRDWPLVLRAALGMVAEGFGLGPLATLRGAWWVLRANQAWAPYPDNDRVAAVRYMTRFYGLVSGRLGLRLDPARAARLEVHWWHQHRILQRETRDADLTRLAAALTALYAYVYERTPQEVAEAARLRAEAMAISDDWVAAGAPLDDPRLTRERAVLIDSYRSLLAAVRERPGGPA